MNEFLEQFLIESRELIAQATEDLLALEHQPGDAGRFDSAFRAFHTLKGAAGIMDFDAMARTTHAAEDVLSEVRGGARQLTPALVNDCLACLDQVTAWLAAMEASEALPEAADAEAASMLARLAPAPRASMAASPPAPVIAAGALPAFAAAIFHEQIALLASPGGEGSAGRTASAWRVIGNILRRYGNIAPPAEAPKAREEEPARPARVDLERIETLVNLAGELIIVKNAFGHAIGQSQVEHAATKLLADLKPLQFQFERLAGDLLRAALAARVLPLRQVFQRFPRLVRELAAGLDKKIRLVTEGEATEADKRIVEALFEPLLHVLRNAVDHGIETPAQRAAAGKPELALVHLRALRAGDEIVIEVADDGKGIDPDAIRKTALARGLAAAETLAAMPPAEVLELIFAPGFSTAAEVTRLSGRGVGMDAVRNAVSGLGGKVTVQSTLGAGTVIRFHLPFTLMLTRVLTVEAGGQAFGIPFDAVVETRQFAAGEVAALGAARAVTWRGQTLPLIGLAGMLNLPEAALGQAAGLVRAVIVEHGGEWGAIEVDRLGGQMELMLKPLDGLLAGMQGVAGTALFGDGRVLIVLELQELLK